MNNHTRHNYKGKTILITGAATGIGRATAKAFAECGTQVVIGDINPDAAETVRLIEEKGQNAIFIETDVSDADSVKNLVEQTVQKYGIIDFAFNNAGVLCPTASLADMDEKDFDKTIAVDLKGVFLCMKYEIEAMLKTNGGAIVNTASVAGVVADPDMAPYVAAKHGVIGLTKAAALDYAQQNIRVNAIAPGLVRTPMTERWLSDSKMNELVTNNNPMHRAAEPQEISSSILYLCSPEASFVNGSTFVIDGGQTIH
ncbi:SDR family NAD(P)-dependent oxidoreductase [Lutibacter sp. B1]|uniref:SDR family NAD(P)-dependent oxidoreductase n=1 Tax=Lutibacter sp. B1 TaxID=2725996 RepID=UPI0014570801|nr:glucose 1-dehydrogenase [Lutibacter sp. B1]NLP59259.1 SDR family oxidoreductase [Lutibacter sp. B1]